MKTSPAKTGHAAASIDRPDEESMDPLPPMDGADDEEGEPPAEDLEDTGEHDGADPFDDATGEGDSAFEFLADGGLGAAATRAVVEETGLLDDAAEAEELDIGVHDLEAGERDDLRSDVDEPGVGDEDFGLADDASQKDTDAGEEGPDAEDEELRVEDLPQLDADDEGELEDATLVDRWLIGPLADGAAEEARPAWDDRAWDRVAWVSRAALDAAGVAPGAVTALATLDGALVIATDRSPNVYASLDEGKTFVAKSGWHTRTHTLFAGDALPDENSALTATMDRDGTPVMLVRRDGDDLGIVYGKVGASVVARPVGVEAALAPNMAIALAARAPALALGQHGAGTYWAADGTTWTRIDGTASTTALAFLDDAGTLLVALYSPAEERSWLVRAGADGVAHTVAELGGDETDDLDVRVHAIAWDEARRTAWVAGAFGIAGFRRI